jgi:predicted nucleotidyltransferase component of viral defense system
MNKNISNIHLEILDDGRRRLFEKLASCSAGFILGGGTALALQLKHRKSFDFDFFSELPIQKSLLEKISHTLKVKNVSIDTRSELTFFTQEEVKITFLHYSFKSIYSPAALENGMFIFPTEQIAIHKSYTIGRRGEYRDYYDLFMILKHKYMNLGKIISDAKDTYGSIFDEKIFLEQLVYFKDMTNFEIIPPDQGVLFQPDEVKRFLQTLVGDYLKYKIA